MTHHPLFDLVPPPANPVLPSGEPCPELAPLTALPEDWLTFGRVYGRGQFVHAGDQNPYPEAVIVKSPFDPILAHDQAGLRRVWKMLTDRGCRYDLPVPLHPSVPGMLEIGGDTHELKLYYLTDDDPADWKLVVQVPDEWRPIVLDVPLLTFLHRLLTDQYEFDGFRPFVGTVGPVEFRPY